MAPSSVPLSYSDYESCVLNNARFICRKDAELTTITTEEHSGEFKAYVLKTEGRQREPLLFHAAESPDKAWKGLFEKSCQATQNYITTSGFGFLPRLKKLRSINCDSDDDSDSDSDTSLASSAALSGGSSWSDDDTVSLGLSRAKKIRDIKSEKKASRKASKSSKRRSDPDVSSSSDSDTDSHPRVTPPLPLPRSFLPSDPRRVGGFPMPPTGPPRPPSQPFPFPRPLERAPGAPLGPPGLMVPPPPRQQPKADGAVDVRLTIRWAQHGEARVFVSSRASLLALQDAAVQYVRAHPTAFPHAAPADTAPPSLRRLHAVVRNCFFSNSRFDMTNYAGDDLTRLFASKPTAIPHFEVDVVVAPGSVPSSEASSPPPPRYPGVLRPTMASPMQLLD